MRHSGSPLAIVMSDSSEETYSETIVDTIIDNIIDMNLLCDNHLARLREIAEWMDDNISIREDELEMCVAFIAIMMRYGEDPVNVIDNLYKFTIYDFDDIMELDQLISDACDEIGALDELDAIKTIHYGIDHAKVQEVLIRVTSCLPKHPLSSITAPSAPPIAPNSAPPLVPDLAPSSPETIPVEIESRIVDFPVLLNEHTIKTLNNKRNAIDSKHWEETAVIRIIEAALWLISTNLIDEPDPIVNKPSTDAPSGQSHDHQECINNNRREKEMRWIIISFNSTSGHEFVARNCNMRDITEIFIRGKGWGSELYASLLDHDWFINLMASMFSRQVWQYIKWRLPFYFILKPENPFYELLQCIRHEMVLRSLHYWVKPVLYPCAARVMGISDHHGDQSTASERRATASEHIKDLPTQTSAYSRCFVNNPACFPRHELIDKAIIHLLRNFSRGAMWFVAEMLLEITGSYSCLISESFDKLALNDERSGSSEYQAIGFEHQTTIHGHQTTIHGHQTTIHGHQTTTRGYQNKKSAYQFNIPDNIRQQDMTNITNFIAHSPCDESANLIRSALIRYTICSASPVMKARLS